jgi:predicted ATP-binding protein involved in virulence
MTPLEMALTAIPILAFIGGFVNWVLKRTEKKAREREEKIVAAKIIEKRLFDLEASYGRMTEQNEEQIKQLKSELRDVQRDFAHFVQKMLFDK